MTRAASSDYGLAGIFDNVRDGLVLVRFPSREVVLFNRAASEMSGIHIEDAVGLRLDRIFPDAAVIATARKSASQPMGTWPGHDQVVLQTRTTGRRGRAKDVEIHFCRVDDVGTGDPLVLLVMRPSSEVELDAAVQQGNQALERAARLEAEAREHALLFSQAAHEFRTPLTVLALQAELLRSSLRDVDSTQEHALALIHANVHRLVLLSQDLADLARADAGRLVVRVAPLDLARLLRDEVDNFQPLAAREGLSIALLAPRSPIPIVGDPGRILQVLGNFLGNAIKFTPRGGRITVELVKEDGQASVRIHDTGPGMDADDQARLFRPFVRIDTPNAPKKPGTGLGLHLSKRIVEAHGGEVGCHSAGRGHGMTFWFNLPLAKRAADAGATADWGRAAKESRAAAASPRPSRAAAVR